MKGTPCRFLLQWLYDATGQTEIENGKAGKYDEAIFEITNGNEIHIPAEKRGTAIHYIRGVWLANVDFLWESFYAPPRNNEPNLYYDGGEGYFVNNETESIIFLPKSYENGTQVQVFYIYGTGEFFNYNEPFEGWPWWWANSRTPNYRFAEAGDAAQWLALAFLNDHNKSAHIAYGILNDIKKFIDRPLETWLPFESFSASTKEDKNVSGLFFDTSGEVTICCYTPTDRRLYQCGEKATCSIKPTVTPEGLLLNVEYYPPGWVVFGKGKNIDLQQPNSSRLRLTYTGTGSGKKLIITLNTSPEKEWHISCNYFHAFNDIKLGKNDIILAFNEFRTLHGIIYDADIFPQYGISVFIPTRFGQHTLADGYLYHDDEKNSYFRITIHKDKAKKYSLYYSLDHHGESLVVFDHKDVGTITELDMIATDLSKSCDWRFQYIPKKTKKGVHYIMIIIGFGPPECEYHKRPKFDFSVSYPIGDLLGDGFGTGIPQITDLTSFYLKYRANFHGKLYAGRVITYRVKEGFSTGTLYLDHSGELKSETIYNNEEVIVYKIEGVIKIKPSNSFIVKKVNLDNKMDEDLGKIVAFKNTGYAIYDYINDPTGKNMESHLDRVIRTENLSVRSASIQFLALPDTEPKSVNWFQNTSHYVIDLKSVTTTTTPTTFSETNFTNLQFNFIRSGSIMFHEFSIDKNADLGITNLPRFTLQWNKNGPIYWRGPVYIGYCVPAIWYLTGHTDISNNIISLFQEAQNDYQQKFGSNKGPFTPVYLPYSPLDCLEYGELDSFGFNGPDPNTEWGGWQYRAFNALCHYCCVSNDKTAIEIADNFFEFISQRINIMDNVYVLPSTFKKDGTILCEYYSPDFVALFCRGCLFLYLTTGDTKYLSKAHTILENTYIYKVRKYGKKAGSIPGWDTITNQEMTWTFHQAEVGITLALALGAPFVGVRTRRLINENFIEKWIHGLYYFFVYNTKEFQPAALNKYYLPIHTFEPWDASVLWGNKKPFLSPSCGTTEDISLCMEFFRAYKDLFGEDHLYKNLRTGILNLMGVRDE